MNKICRYLEVYKFRKLNFCKGNILILCNFSLQLLNLKLRELSNFIIFYLIENLKYKGSKESTNTWYNNFLQILK